MMALLIDSSHNRASGGPVRKDHASRWIYFLILVMILLAVGVVRYRLLDFPLERDEGGFAYIGRMILQGVAPYREAYDFKPPGLYLTYALVMGLFGQTPRGIHFALLLTDLSSIVLIYFIARRYMDETASLAAALVMGILSLTPNVLGFAAHATHFVVFWMLAGYLLLLRSPGKHERTWLILSGMAFGLSAMMKQPGLLFILFGCLLFFLRQPEGGRRLLIDFGVFLAGVVIPVSGMVAWLAMSGDLGRFLYWNFAYGSEFGTRIGLSDALVQFTGELGRVTAHWELLWLAALLGLVFAFIRPPLNRGHLHLAGLLIASFVALGLGFQFRSHYFVMLLPSVSLYCGFACFRAAAFMTRRLRPEVARAIGFGMILLAVGYGGLYQWNYFFRDDPVSLSRQIYFPNPFAEAPAIASFVESQTRPGDRVAVLGSEPEILFLAGRQSATRYLYMYFFMEVHPASLEMQREAAADIAGSSPPVVVLVTQPISWGTRPQSERYIFEWANAYLKKKYELVGIVDQISPDRTEYRWEDEMHSYARLAEASVLIFRRRS